MQNEAYMGQNKKRQGGAITAHLCVYIHTMYDNTADWLQIPSYQMQDKMQFELTPHEKHLIYFFYRGMSKTYQNTWLFTLHPYTIVSPCADLI